MTCNPHPDAPHGFDRNRSHDEGRYACDCESWYPPHEYRDVIELTPEKLREAADVVEAFNYRCGRLDPDLEMRNPASLRRAADDIEAKNAKKAERDKAVEAFSKHIFRSRRILCGVEENLEE